MSDIQPTPSSVKKIKEYILRKADALKLPTSSIWSYCCIRSTEVFPQMVIVGLLSSSENGKLQMEDPTDSITCVLTNGPAEFGSCVKFLEPSHIGQRIKMKNFMVIIEQFHIGTCICHKVYIVCKLCDICECPVMELHKTDPGPPASAHCSEVNVYKHNGMPENLTSNLVFQSDKAKCNNMEQPTISTTENKRSSSMCMKSDIDVCEISETSSLVFYCLAKSGLYYRHNDGITFCIYCAIIQMNDSCEKEEDVEFFACSNFRITSNDSRNLCRKYLNSKVRSIQLVFVASAVKWFHTIHQGCVYKLDLLTGGYRALLCTIIEQLIPGTYALQIQGAVKLTILDSHVLHQIPLVCKLNERVKSEPNSKIFSVREAANFSSFSELISVYGIVCQRTHEMEKNSILLSTLSYERFVTLDVGILDNLEIRLEICDTTHTSVKIAVFINVDNLVYPFGLLPGATVKITSLDGHISKNGRIYFCSTVITDIEILTISPERFTASTENRVSLLSDYMASKQLLLSENIAECLTLSASKFTCLAEVQKVLEVAMQLLCPGCKQPIVMGQKCTFVGCHSNSLPIDSSASSVWASDGSACIIAKFKGDNVRTILQIPKKCWSSLLSSPALEKTYRSTFMKSPQNESLIRRTLRSAAQNPNINRTVLLELKWNAAYNVGRFGKDRNGPAVLFCTRIEEMCPLAAASRFLPTVGSPPVGDADPDALCDEHPLCP